MKIKSKILYAIILMVISVVMPYNKIAAAGNQCLLVGNDYGSGEINTSVDVTIASGNLATIANKTLLTSTKPTINWMLKSNGNVPYMQSDILFFSGHGNSNGMYFYYGNDSSRDFSISTGTNNSNKVGIGSYNMNNVDLVVYAGCQTASRSSNITKATNDAGAKAALGWTTSVGASSHTQWLSTFWQEMVKGKYIGVAMMTADSKTYSDSRVKNGHLDGNSYLTIVTKPFSLSTNVQQISAFNDRLSKSAVDIDVSNKNDEEILKEVSKWIQSKYDSSFDLSEYEVKKVVKDERDIIDIKLLIDGDIKTNLGYTIFVSQGKITHIFNNMKEIDIVSSNAKTNSSYLTLGKILNDANDRLDLVNFDILSQDSYKYYDSDDKKIYFVVATELENKYDHSIYIDEYKKEI